MYTLGIDLGGTNIKTGVVNEHNAIIGRGQMPTNVPRPAGELMDDIAKACFMAVENAGISMSDIAAAGIGTPGTVNTKTGVLEYANNLYISQYPMAGELTKRLAISVKAENDANAAALGEAIAGAAKGTGNAVCVTLGTGVGSGIIIDGKIYSGTNNAGGEMGHTVIKFDGKECNCGRRGCWESYASVSALIAQTKEKMLERRDSAMWEIAGELGNVNGITSFKAAREGDAAGKEVVDRYAYYVACGIINIINIFQPDVVCVGGAVSKEGEFLLAPIREVVVRERYSKYSARQSEIVAATLGNDAGIIGAAMLYTQ